MKLIHNFFYSFCNTIHFISFICRSAACTSGFSGVYFERILKNSGTSLWMRNIQMVVQHRITHCLLFIVCKVVCVLIYFICEPITHYSPTKYLVPTLLNSKILTLTLPSPSDPRSLTLT